MTEANRFVDSASEQKKNTSTEVKFYPDKGSLLLIINKTLVDCASQAAKAQKLNLIQKNEFHLTVIGSDTGEEILAVLNQLDPAEKSAKLAAIENLAKDTDWQPVLKQEFFYITKNYNDPDPKNPQATIPETRRSIIQTADIKELSKFYQQLEKIIGKNFVTPFPHVTLYTNSTRSEKAIRGIGIYSQEDFASLNPEKI